MHVHYVQIIIRRFCTVNSTSVPMKLTEVNEMVGVLNFTMREDVEGYCSRYCGLKLFPKMHFRATCFTLNVSNSSLTTD